MLINNSFSNYLTPSHKLYFKTQKEGVGIIRVKLVFIIHFYILFGKVYAFISNGVYNYFKIKNKKKEKEINRCVYLDMKIS